MQGWRMKMSAGQKKQLAVLISLLVVCISVNMVYQADQSRKTAWREALCAVAYEMQEDIDRLQAEQADSEAATSLQTALGYMMRYMGESFGPGPVPEWLRISAGIVSLLAALGIWRVGALWWRGRAGQVGQSQPRVCGQDEAGSEHHT